MFVTRIDRVRKRIFLYSTLHQAGTYTHDAHFHISYTWSFYILKKSKLRRKTLEMGWKFSKSNMRAHLRTIWISDFRNQLPTTLTFRKWIPGSWRMPSDRNIYGNVYSKQQTSNSRRDPIRNHKNQERRQLYWGVVQLHRRHGKHPAAFIFCLTHSLKEMICPLSSTLMIFYGHLSASFRWIQLFFSLCKQTNLSILWGKRWWSFRCSCFSSFYSSKEKRKSYF